MDGIIFLFPPPPPPNNKGEFIFSSKSYLDISEMTREERQFLNAVVLRQKPKKLLEIGVSAGGSSIVLLNAIRNREEATVYAIDRRDYYYQKPSLRTGYYVNKYPDLKKQYRLLTGSLALSFMDEIGAGIDFCLIDTVHSNPGEILDFLMVLPYLKEEAIVVFHDIAQHTENYPHKVWHITNCLLLSAITGTKILQGNFTKETERDHYFFPNIGGIKVNQLTREHIFEIFNLLSIKWAYLPGVEEQVKIFNHFERFYDKFYLDLFQNILEWQRQCAKIDRNSKIMTLSLSSIAWGIKRRIKNKLKGK